MRDTPAGLTISSTLRGLLGGHALRAGEPGEELLAHESLRSLPRPSGPIALATPNFLLSAPLRSLATALQPDRMLVDQGGAGQCGPNTLAYLLGLVELSDCDGPSLRTVAAVHSRSPSVLSRVSSVFDESGMVYTIQELIEACISHWPKEVLHGKPRTAETWRELIVHPTTWTDVAFTQLVADKFEVSFHHLGVDDLSNIFDMGTISPCDGRASKALCEIGVWYNRHFVACLDVATTAAAASASPAPGQPPTAPSGRPSTRETLSDALSFPLTHRDQVEQLLGSEHPPTVLVGFEFSGALRTTLENAGLVAISADFRPCDVGGMHYQGDARDLLDITLWDRAYLFPPCFQQLRGDLDCIEAKILDQRAFWGCALVLLCLFATTAAMVFVEQPDVLFHDCFYAQEWPDVDVYSFRTSHYGDDSDKFVRLTTRNVVLDPPPFLHRTVPAAKRSQFDYVDADDRDRQRSSWVPHRQTCLALASARPLQVDPPPSVTFYLAMESFAVEWHEQFHAVPSGYLSSDAQPPDESLRSYQKQRGPGDGRSPPCVVPLTLRGALYSLSSTTEAFGMDDSGESSDEQSQSELDFDTLVALKGAAIPTAAVTPVPRSTASSSSRRRGLALAPTAPQT